MAHEVLENLTDEEFGAEHGFISNMNALHRSLRQSEEVNALRTALRNEQITEKSIRKFVSDLLEDLEKGVKFPHRYALAAIAVALEEWNSAFAEEYLLDLARLDRSEMREAIEVAQISVKIFQQQPKNDQKEMSLDTRQDGSDFEIDGYEYSELSSHTQTEMKTMEIG